MNFAKVQKYVDAVKLRLRFKPLAKIIDMAKQLF
jgi:hypothetical protein